MNETQWQQVKALLEGALELPREERQKFIESHCADEVLRGEALVLLAGAQSDDDFLKSSPGLLAGAMLAAAGSDRLLSTGDVLARRFRIQRFLGRGGMGEVYEAFDAETGTSMAVKTIRSAVRSDERMVARLRRELVLARAVTHRNVCRIFDLHQHASAEEAGPLLFLTMELLQGETLREHLLRAGPFTPAEALPLILQIVSALSAAHDAGVIHGDLKSSNIMLVPSGDGAFRAVVMDFGIASATGVGAGSTAGAGGTRGYMAPEQARGEILTASDIYSLGVVIHEMVTGRQPDPETPGAPGIDYRALPAVWQSVISRCLQREPGDRFDDVRDVAAALVRRGRTPHWMAGMAWIKGMAAGAAVLILAGWGWWFLWGRIHRSEGQPVVAVVGFKNSSGSLKTRYLSLLLSLAIDSELQAGGGVRVVPESEVARCKTELGIHDDEKLPPDACLRVQSATGADLLILGSYTVSNDPGEVRLKVTMQNAKSGKAVASVQVAGRETDPQALSTSAAAKIRQRLSLRGNTPAETGGERAALPGSLEAMRLYADGLQRFRSFDALGARSSLEKAIAVEPSFGQAHSVLARTWAALGYDQRAREEAGAALKLSSNLLPADRLEIEGSYWEAMKDNAKAAAAYEKLLGLAPNNPDYLLLLARAQTGRKALETVARMRRLPAPVRDDPRIDLAEAEAANSMNNFVLERPAALAAARKAASVGAVLLEAQALLHAAWSSWVLGQPANAASEYSQARDLFQRVGDQNGMGRTLRGLGLIAQYTGDLAAAQAQYKQALAIFRGIGSLDHAATTLNGLAIIASDQGRLSDALEFYRESLDICHEVQSATCTGTALNNIAYTLYRKGRLEEAKVKLDAALAEFERVDGQYGKTFVLSTLGDMLKVQGRLSDAERYLRAALRLSRKLGDRTSAASTEVSLSAVLLYKDEPALARHTCTRAIDEQTKLSEGDAAALGRLILADINLKQNRPLEAEEQLKLALPVLLRSGRKDDAAVAQAMQAEVDARLGRGNDALRGGEQAVTTLGASENRLARVTVLLWLGRMQRQCADLQKARQTILTAKATAADCGYSVLMREADKELELSKN